MISVNLQIENLDQLRSNFGKAPQLTLKYLSAAVKASIFAIEKQAIDRNFQFKTPRGRRTGWIERSFAFGRYIEPLVGSIGPTATYAPYVYFGTRRGIKPNPFMDRVASASEKDINKFFNEAVDKLTDDLAKV